MNFVRDLLTDKQRKIVYAIFALVGVLLGAVCAGYAAVPVALPIAVKVALQVYAFLGGPMGLLAAANVPPQKP